MSVIVLIVWGIITLQTTSYIWFISKSILTENLCIYLLIMPFFITIVGLIYINYYLTIYTDPGSPSLDINLSYQTQIGVIKDYAKERENKKKERTNHSHHDHQHDHHHDYNQEDIQSLTKTSYCFKCDIIKQPRVHHCKICNKCILRMDHHCIFVNNCVGLYNQKYFLLFLMYAILGLSIVWVTVLIDYLRKWHYLNLIENQWKAVIVYTMAWTSLVMSIMIWGLFNSQMGQLTDNVTTIQAMIPGIKFTNPFNKKSRQRNFEQICGDTAWLIPTNPFANRQETTNIDVSETL